MEELRLLGLVQSLSPAELDLIGIGWSVESYEGYLRPGNLDPAHQPIMDRLVKLEIFAPFTPRPGMVGYCLTLTGRAVYQQVTGRDSQ